MKDVIVTGAAGFLGSHIAKHHLDAGDRVLGIDNFCSSFGCWPGKPSEHYKLLMDHPSRNYGYMHQDITHPDVLEFLVRNKPQLIYNFACPASPPRYQAMPVETMMTCVVGTRNMLEHAKRTGAVVVHASTSEIYGDPDVTPQPESYRGIVNSYGPRSCYDEGKRAAEALCFDYLQKYHVDARMVRIFNTYGPHMDPDDGRVVSNFIVQALRGEAITLYGSGRQSRSFCYVDDLIRGIIAMGALHSNPGTPINLGNPNEFTVKALADEIHILTKASKPKLRSMPEAIDDPKQRCPDITFARDILNWKPCVELEEGLLKTIEYFRKVI